MRNSTSMSTITVSLASTLSSSQKNPAVVLSAAVPVSVTVPVLLLLMVVVSRLATAANLSRAAAVESDVVAATVPVVVVVDT